MILLRQKLYSGFRFIKPKHSLGDVRLMLDRHITNGGKAEGDRFVKLYHKLTKPHKFIS